MRFPPVHRWLFPFAAILLFSGFALFMRVRAQERPLLPAAVLDASRNSFAGSPRSPDALGRVRTGYGAPGPGAEAPLALVHKDRSVTLYSRQGNRFNDLAWDKDGVWLATQRGVRRVDTARGTARQYTQADGLPGDHVAAVTADTDGAAWCIVQNRAEPHGWKAALCRFDPKKDRWQKLRDAVIPPTPSTGWASYSPPGANPGPGYPAVTAARRFVCFSLGAVGRREPRAPAAALLVWDKRERRWQDAVWEDPEPASPPAGDRLHWPWRRDDRSAYRSPTPYLLVNSLHAIRRSGDVWLATSAGLLRYRPGERRWQRYLPERSFPIEAAVASAGGDTLWLVNRVARPASRPDAGWLLSRLDAGTGETRDWALPAPERDPPERPFWPGDGTPLGVSVTGDGAVWVVAPQARPFFGGVTFHVLDPPSGRLRTFTADGFRRPDLLARVPDEALLPLILRTRPSGPGTSPLAREALSRFARWFSPGAPLPDDLAFPGWRWPNQVEEPDGSATWAIENGDALVRRSAAGTGRFPLPGGAVAGMPQVMALAAATAPEAGGGGGRIFAMGAGSGVRVWDRGAWLPEEVTPPRARRRTLVFAPLEAPLWADRESGAVYLASREQIERYEPRMNRWTLFHSFAPGQNRVLLGGDEKRLWLADEGRANLFAIRAGDGREERVTPSPPASTRGSLRPVCALGGVVWHQTRDQVIGYDTRREAWTEPLSLPANTSRVLMSQDGSGRTRYPTDVERASFCLAGTGGDEGTYVVTATAASAAVHRYDANTRRWSAVTPPLTWPEGDARFDHSYAALALLCADVARIWLLEPFRAVLWEYDRARKTWTAHRELTEIPVFGDHDSAVGARGADGALYVGSRRGTFRFDTSKRAWQPLPVSAPNSKRMLSRPVITRDALWVLCRDFPSGEELAARFDKSTHKWTLMGSDHGFPTRLSVSRFVSDGDSVWAVTHQHAYHFDRRTDRWRGVANVLPPMDGPAGRTLIQDVAPDTGDQGSGAWVLIHGREIREGQPNGPQIRYAPALARYDKERDAWKLFDPKLPSEPGRSIIAVSLLVEADVVWVATSEGPYRFDRAAGTWRKVDPPRLPPGQITRIVRASDGALWFIGHDNVLRWAHP